MYTVPSFKNRLVPSEKWSRGTEAETRKKCERRYAKEKDPTTITDRKEEKEEK